MKLLLWNEHLEWKWMVQHVHNLGCLYPNLTCVLTPLKIEAPKCRIIQLSMRIYRWIKLSFVIKLFWIIIPTSIHIPISSFKSIIRKSTIPYYSCNRFIDFLHVCNTHNKSILYAHNTYVKFIYWNGFNYNIEWFGESGHIWSSCNNNKSLSFLFPFLVLSYLCVVAIGLIWSYQCLKAKIMHPLGYYAFLARIMLSLGFLIS